MVRQQEKYKWKYRESHLLEWNRRRFFDSELRRTSLLNDIFMDFEKQYNPLFYETHSTKGRCPMNKKHLESSLEEAVKKWEKKDRSLRSKIDGINKGREDIERWKRLQPIKASSLINYYKEKEFERRISFLASVAHQQYEAMEFLNKVIESLRKEIAMRDALLKMVLESNSKHRMKKK